MPCWYIRLKLRLVVTFCRKSLDLVEALLRLSEVGHYQQVSELFKFPIQNCPDMLVLALLQITVSVLFISSFLREKKTELRMLN